MSHEETEALNDAPTNAFTDEDYARLARDCASAGLWDDEPCDWAEPSADERAAADAAFDEMTRDEARGRIVDDFEIVAGDDEETRHLAWRGDLLAAMALAVVEAGDTSAEVRVLWYQGDELVGREVWACVGGLVWGPEDPREGPELAGG